MTQEKVRWDNVSIAYASRSFRDAYHVKKIPKFHETRINYATRYALKDMTGSAM